MELTWLNSKLEIALDYGFVKGGEKKAPILEVEIELNEER